MKEPTGESYVTVCRVSELTDGEAIIEEVDGTEIAVFLVDDEVQAIENSCPHQGGPLGDGKVEDGCVYCPWHGWQFDIETGEHAQGIKNAQKIPVTVDGDDVCVVQ